MKHLYGGVWLIAALCLVWSNAPAEEAAGRWVRVVGEGQVSTRPDVAYANVGIRVSEPTVAVAMAQNKQLMAGILKALAALGIAERDIATNAFDIHYERPPRNPPEDTAEAGKYWVNNMVRVTIRDLEKVDAVLDGVTQAGANQIWGVQFGLDNTDAAQVQARKAAVAQARAKAEELARASGAELGAVLRISEVMDNGPGLMRARSMEMDAGGYTSPGEQTINARLEVVYELK